MIKRKKLKRKAAPAPESSELAALLEERRKIQADRDETYRQVGDGWPDAPERLRRLDDALAKIGVEIEKIEATRATA